VHRGGKRSVRSSLRSVFQHQHDVHHGGQVWQAAYGNEVEGIMQDGIGFVAVSIATSAADPIPYSC
jgi:hypothetical protein